LITTGHGITFDDIAVRCDTSMSSESHQWCNG